MQTCFYYNPYTGTRTWTRINVNPAFLGSWDHKSWLTVFQQHHWNKQQNSSRQQQLQRDANIVHCCSSRLPQARMVRRLARTHVQICSTVPMISLFSPTPRTCTWDDVTRSHHILWAPGEVAEDQHLMQQSTIQLQNNAYRILDTAAC